MGQDVLKKKQVKNHSRGRCSEAWYFSCVDCNNSFAGADLDKHTSCISEKDKLWGQYAPKKAVVKVQVSTDAADVVPTTKMLEQKLTVEETINTEKEEKEKTEKKKKEKEKKKKEKTKKGDDLQKNLDRVLKNEKKK